MKRPAALARTAREATAARLADLAVAALIDEAMLTPKPGLVDLRGCGAHTDLNWLMMCDSALALHADFGLMALAGLTLTGRMPLREQIGRIGRSAEQTMMRVTGGVNTHRGAIWALGLLVTAAAQDMAACAPHEVAARAGELARQPDRFAPAVTGNKGEQACLAYEVGGARGQAQAGFPHVIEIALPALREARLRGDSEQHARLSALLSVMCSLDDTCILARGGKAGLRATQRGARAVLRAGGPATRPGRAALRRLECDLINLNLSPGGAADLLAAALLLERLEQSAGGA